MSAVGSLWRSLWRFHWVLAGILMLEYALTFVILVGAAAVLVARARAINQVSGVDEQGLYVLTGSGQNRPVHRFEWLDAENRFKTLAQDGRVAMGSSVPFFGRNVHVVPIHADDNAAPNGAVLANIYAGNADFPRVLGLNLLRGRLFHDDEIVFRYGDAPRVALLSQALANRLFHGQEAVGRQVMINRQAVTVVGVVASLAAPQYLGGRQTGYTVVLPKMPEGNAALVIRYTGSTSHLDDVLAALQARDKGKVRWKLRPYDDIRAQYFGSDRITVIVLAVVILVVLLTAVCGILGLTAYWISRRKQQIAIRRALGARKRDIVLHFLGETGFIVALGLVSGVTVCFALVGFVGRFQADIGPATWMLSIGLILLLALVVVYASLRRWLRLQPVELIRSI